MMEVHNTTEMMVAAATALREGDSEALQGLKAVAKGWLQTEEEMMAQVSMLDAMLEAVFALEEAGA